ESHLVEASGVSSEQIRFHRVEGCFGRFPATAHLAKTNQTVVSFYLNNGTHETAPVTTVSMSQRRLKRHRDGRGFDVRYLHKTRSPDGWRYLYIVDCRAFATIRVTFDADLISRS